MRKLGEMRVRRLLANGAMILRRDGRAWLHRRKDARSTAIGEVELALVHRLCAEQELERYDPEFDRLAAPFPRVRP